VSTSNTSSPFATICMELRSSEVILGTRIPWVVDCISRMALGSGVDVPMPMDCPWIRQGRKARQQRSPQASSRELSIKFCMGEFHLTQSYRALMPGIRISDSSVIRNDCPVGGGDRSARLRGGELSGHVRHEAFECVQVRFHGFNLRDA